MKLKSLEIKGFKSFADKTLVMLDHPITGIVGPNGCGKSNIVDAIRWVIGEHKIKSLRSDNLDDLIFNGSKTRSPSGMAEVSLTFENNRNLLPTEFTTVTITRKFYKSGESEYRLNDVSCRLKDIHNLFLDTGVSNDSYAIIELGMVDDIIRDKDNSRRRMLEQAAGISMYKARKKEAKQKLEGTQQDLARIEDLLFEISNNLRTLENQARKARRYFQVKEEYQQVSLELAKASLAHFNEKYKELNDRQQREMERKTQLESGLEAEEEALAKEKLILVEKEQELGGLQKQFNELLSRIQQLEADRRLAEQRSGHLQEKEKSLVDFLQGAETQRKDIEASIQRAKNQMEEKADSLRGLEDRLEALKERMEDQKEAYDQARESLDSRRREEQQQQRRQFELEKTVAIADTSLGNLQRSISTIEEETESRRRQIEEIDRELESRSGVLDQGEQQLKAYLEQRETLKEKILEAQAELDHLRSELVAQNRSLDAKRNEHDLLKSLVDSLEGYPQSMKFLKKNMSWKGKAPLLSDVFGVEEGYKAALENVLEDYLNYYLISDPRDAMEAIGLLKDQQKGKAKFFLVDSPLPSPPDDSSPVPEEWIPALDLVKVDAPYQSLARVLLSQVYLVEDEAIWKDYPLGSTQVLVSRSGSVIRGRHKVHGGSVGLFEGNKLGRAKNLELLSEQIRSLTESTEALKKQIQDTQQKITGLNMDIQDQKIEALKKETNEWANQIQNLQSRREHLEQLNAESESRIQGLKDQWSQRQDKIRESRQNLESMTESLQRLRAEIAAEEDRFHGVEKEFTMASQAYHNENLQWTREQSLVVGLRQEMNLRISQQESLEKQILSNQESLLQTREALSRAESEAKSGEESYYQLLNRKEEENRILSEKDRNYLAFRQQIAEKESQFNQKRRARENAEQLIQAIKDQVNEMKLQLAGMKERLRVEFKVELEEILDQQRTTDLAAEELEAEAEKLKRRLEQMGEVNPTAIDAFTEMKARYDFIMEQKTDLEKARDSLLATIEEVEITANTQFKETFEKVRENFIKVFKALFSPEDNCDLRLTNPEELADTGIEIYAQPKGKRPSTLTQLSGGEKTLTSTAFLFAIYLIKPAPFCILDEVDAPLDDANVQKFTQMIRQFSDNSQFIIVTHNKQTMASVDVIYGVTMQEAGVSRLVPVDFRSLSHSA